MKFFWTCALSVVLLMGCNRPEPVPRQNGALGYRLEIKNSGAGSFTALNQATLTPEADHLTIKATGNDPSIGLPPLSIRPGAQVAVRLDVTVPSDTLVELYYTTMQTPVFTPGNVLSVPVKGGRNVVVFEINDPDFQGGLRVDPGQLAGDYVLHQVEVFSSEAMAIGAAPAGASPSP
jgi:hypothetical protein